MTVIDPTARVDKNAQIGRNVTVGAYSVIGAHVAVGDDCRIESHVSISGHTTIGARTIISPFASLGTAPQSVHYKGEPTTLSVGSDCSIREYVTMNIGTAGASGRGTTIVGDKCMLMNGAHVGHDCVVGNNVVFASNATLGGFCDIGDNVFLGGLCAVHQFTRIGEQAMIGGLVGVTSDIIPYALVIGHRSTLAGLNRIGLRRRGMSAEALRNLYSAYRAIFDGEGPLKERAESVGKMWPNDPYVMRIVEFIRNAKRRIAQPRRRGEVADEE